MKRPRLVLLLLACAVPWVLVALPVQDRLGTPILPYPSYKYADAEVGYPVHIMTAGVQGNMSGADNTPANNPITNAGATLGRVLFYDKRLSRNFTLSCGSCHQQKNGFSDPRRFSVGAFGGLTGRNSMNLANGRFYVNGHFFWDERAVTLEQQVLMPIQDPVEMGMTMPEVVERLQKTSFYRPLFRAAFGSEQIDNDRISKALAQFVRSMVSYRSKFDSAFNAQGVPNFQGTLTAQEFLGLRLFQPVPGMPPIDRGCFRCHGLVGQISNQARNNGLDLNTPGGGRFKSPSLRDIAKTGPYMHDGRFPTLRAVIDFYNAGVQNNPNLDPILRDPNTGLPRRLNLNENEKQALEAFLRTLSDTGLATDPKFADPFIHTGLGGNNVAD
jgi:cytochrome c peroxidase